MRGRGIAPETWQLQIHVGVVICVTNLFKPLINFGSLVLAEVLNMKAIRFLIDVCGVESFDALKFLLCSF